MVRPKKQQKQKLTSTVREESESDEQMKEKKRKFMIDVFYGSNSKRGRKRGRKPKLDNPVNTNDPIATKETLQAECKQEVQGIIKQRKKSRKIDKSESEVNEGMKSESTNVICGVCNDEINLTMWLNHRENKHNNLAWRSDEPPLDFNNHQLISSLLKVMYKKSKTFKCEKCKTVKKSVLGYMSHLTACSKTAEELENCVKVECKICGKKLMPSSINSHMKSSHDPDKAKAKNGVAAADDVMSNDVMIRGQRPKRKSAISVNEMLKKMSKDSSEGDDDSIDDNHGKKQKKAKKRRRLQDDDDAYKVDDEEDEDDEDEKPRGTKRKDKVWLSISKKTSLVTNVDKRYQVELLSFMPRNKAGKGAYEPARKWMRQFTRTFFTNANTLYVNLRPRFEAIPADTILDYLPMNKLSPETARIVRKRVTDPTPLLWPQNKKQQDVAKYKRYKLFESAVYDDGNSIAFCGGSVTKVAWIPTPSSDKQSTNKSHLHDQILCVAVDLDPNDKTNDDYERGASGGDGVNGKEIEAEEALKPSRMRHGLLQFWNFGPLANENRRDDVDERVAPIFEFAIGHDYGRVDDMEFCPSGCYGGDDDHENNGNRLGLVAITSSTDSYVYLHSIARPQKQLNGNMAGGGDVRKLFESRPCVKLALQSNPDVLPLGEMRYHATRVSWSKAKGHEHIAVGYSNGCVALYRLESEIDGQERDQIVRPFRTLLAHSGAITALCLYHLDNGARWLMTGSLDRLQKFWDLKTSNEPIVCHRRGNVTDGKWPTNWIGAITCQDDGTVTNANSTAYCQAREVGANPTSFLYTNSTIGGVAVDDWSNVFVHATSNGEMTGSYPGQIFQNVDLERPVKKRKFFMRHTLLVGKEPRKEMAPPEKREKANNNIPNKQNGGTADAFLLLDEPLNYYETDQRYKMLFVDYNLDKPENLTDDHLTSVGYKSKLLVKSKWNRYDLNGINCVAFDPNEGADLFLAAGYKCGFITCNCIRFLTYS